jgi:hypothetical protein
MRCPYCRHDIRVAGRFCPRCGRQIFGLPGGPRPAAAPPPPPAGQGFGQGPPAPREQAASSETVGKTCPYDQFPISQSDNVIVCPECGVPHHTDCWHENGGCTTYGCARSPSSSPVARAGAQPLQPPPPVIPQTYSAPPRRPRIPTGDAVGAVLAAEIDRNAGNALLYALLGFTCCPIVSVVGFFMALGVFTSMSRTGVDSPTARLKATWAALAGAVGPVVWVVGLISMAQGSGMGMY